MSQGRIVSYRRESDLSVEEFRRVLEESGLGSIRPIGDPERLGRMLAGSQLVVTARGADGHLLGMARCVTDFSWCCFLSEIAVSRQAKGLGVGRGLIAGVRQEIGPEVTLMLASVPDAVGFYERIGMGRVADAFWFRRER